MDEMRRMMKMDETEMDDEMDDETDEIPGLSST